MRIATKLGLSTALIAIFTSILLGSFIYHDLKEQLYQWESKGQLTLAHSIMSKIDHLLYIAQRDMHILVEDEFLQSYVSSPSSRTPQALKQLEVELNERLELTGPWETLMVVDDKGNHLININSHSGHGNISQYPDSYTAYKAAMQGQFYSSDFLNSDHSDHSSIIFAGPIFEDCESPCETEENHTLVKGAIIAHFQWSVILELIQNLDSNLTPHLFNKEGNLIAAAKLDTNDPIHHHLSEHPTIKQALASNTDSNLSILPGVHGADSTLAITVKQQGYKDYLGNQWGLLLEQPAEVVFGPLNKVAWQSASLIFIVLLLLAGLLTVMTFKFTRPIARLSDQTSRIGQGDFTTRLKIHSNDEIGILAANFNEMSRQLARRTADLSASEAKFRRVANTISDIIYTARVPDFVITYINPTIEKWLGYSVEEFLSDSENIWLKSLHPEDKDRVLEEMNTAFSKKEDFTLEYRMLHKDDKTIHWLEDRGSWETDEAGNIIALQGLMTEISERREYIEQLQKKTRALDALHVNDKLLINTTSTNELIQGVCSNLIHQEGYQFAWIGLLAPDHSKQLQVLASAGDNASFITKLQTETITMGRCSCPPCQAMQSKQPFIINDIQDFSESEQCIIHPIESQYQALASLPLIGDGKTLGVINVYSDQANCFNLEEIKLLVELTDNLAYGITSLEAQEQHLQAQEQIAYQAFHDPLTGLPNRSLLMSTLEQEMAIVDRSNDALAIVFIDLDDFKLVNDTLGHEAGDILLKEVSRRIQSVMRKTDLLARQGGDEFIILMTGLSDNQELHKIACKEDQLINPANLAQRIIDVMSSPFIIKSQPAYVGASIGISVYPHDGRDANTVLRFADAAMYRAKEVGRGGYQFYSQALTDKQQHRLSLATQLHQALEQKEFVLHYQPVVDLTKGKMISVEALIRWKSPDGSLIAPNDFLPVAEDTGIIVPIGDWVIEEACRQVKQWQSEGIHLPIAVNLSVRQFWQHDATTKVLETISQTELANDAITIEITETAMSLDEQRMEKAINQFHKAGLKISLDDFGTGYSSLSRLKQMPIHTLKIDKSFVDGIPDNEDDISIVNATILLAHSLGIKSLAEGIETIEQYQWLVNQHCQYGQGYYFSRPVAADKIIELLQSPPSWRLAREG